MKLLSLGDIASTAGIQGFRVSGHEVPAVSALTTGASLARLVARQRRHIGPSGANSPAKSSLAGLSNGALRTLGYKPPWPQSRTE